MNTYNVSDNEFVQSDLYKKFLSTNPALGFLKIRAYAASGAVPIADLPIQISKEIDGNKVIFFEGVTNTSGVIERISLPTIRVNGDNMMAPGFVVYDVTTNYNDEIRTYKVNIYDDIYVVQNINVTPNISYGVND